MAITSARVTVTTTATSIATNSASSGAADSSTLTFLIKNATGTDDVYLGPSGVTSANGFLWSVEEGGFSFDLEPGETLYGRVVTTSQTIHVLGGGR